MLHSTHKNNFTNLQYIYKTVLLKWWQCIQKKLSIIKLLLLSIKKKVDIMSKKLGSYVITYIRSYTTINNISHQFENLELQQQLCTYYFCDICMYIHKKLCSYVYYFCVYMSLYHTQMQYVYTCIQFMVIISYSSNCD